MDPQLPDRRLKDKGISSVQFLLASGLALVLFVAFINIVAIQYGRGALRSALEQGTRSGALTGSVEMCVDKGVDVAGQLLGGRMSDDLVVTCAVAGGSMVANASVTFESWSPFMADVPIEMSARAVVEP